MVERLSKMISCVPFGIQYISTNKKRAPLSRGLEEESLPGTISRQEGGFLFLFFRPNLMTDPHTEQKDYYHSQKYRHVIPPTRDEKRI